jgi:ABC-2 type transport system ATP-binding protein
MLREIFLVPEDPYLPNINYLNYLKHWSVFYPNFNHQCLQTLLQQWEIPTTGQLSQMSYGQRKKFLIAFALATSVKILLLDEPTNGLDITSKMLLKSSLTNYLLPEQLIIISTHQIKEIDTLINKLIFIEQGINIGVFTLEQLQKKFYTKIEKEQSSNQLFSFKTQSGYWVLKERKNKNNVSLDLEIFFTAFHQNKQTIQNILTKP